MTVSDASAEAYCGVRPNITDVCELSLCAAQTVTQPGLVSEACPDPTRLAGSVLGSDQGFSSATFLPQGSRRAVASIVLAMETLSASPEETESIAARLAAGLRVGDVVAVSGELGAGSGRQGMGARCRGVEARSARVILEGPRAKRASFPRPPAPGTRPLPSFCYRQPRRTTSSTFGFVVAC